MQRNKKEEGVQSNQTSISTPLFLPPDPVFLQNPITIDEIHDVINLQELTAFEIDLPSVERNLFLDMEATEDRYPPMKRVKFDSKFFCNYKIVKKIQFIFHCF